MKIKIKDIKENPFKKYIHDGQLNQKRIDILRESIEHGTLPEHFIARKNNGTFELTSGHHRIEALKQTKGIDYEVDVTPVDFSDEQMLIDMVRENITQRDTDYHDTGESIVLARQWLQSGSNDVKLFHNIVEGKKGFQSITQPDSYRSIANFLSKNGKAVSYKTVGNYLNVFDKLNPRLLPKVRKVLSGADKEQGDVTVKQAIALSNIEDQQEQMDIYHAMEHEPDGRPHEHIPTYKTAPEEIKQKVRNGTILLSEVKDTVLDKEIKEYNDNHPRSEFIPNFAGRLRDFDKDVHILEKQVKAFSMVFHDKRFTEKYDTLKPQQQKKLLTLIFDISRRVKKCYDEVEYFRETLGISSEKPIVQIGDGKE